MAHRRPILVRITAVGAVVAFLILVPLASAGSDVWTKFDLRLGEPIADDRTAVAIASAIEEGDDEDDDDEDDEDDEDEDDDDDDDEDDDDSEEPDEGS